MGLNKYKLGDLVSIVDERNNLGIRDFYGINSYKEFMPTVADTEGLDETKYKVVRKNRFVFSGMQTGRDQCIRISMYNQDQPIIVSPAYTTFEISPSAKGVIMPMYFFMLFLSTEKDRLGAFYSDGSIRSNLDWERFCDIELELPSIDIQRKYVNIYNAALKNQQCYERGLDDLKLVCDGHFDSVKKSCLISLGELIERSDKRNSLNTYKESDVRGIMNQKRFSLTKADINGSDLSKFLVIDKDVFAYNSRTDGRDMLVLALNRDEKSVIVTWNYNAFKVKDSKKDVINPEYLYAFFKRSEFDRNVRFNSWGSSQELLSWDNLCYMKVPCPDINIQNAIADINSVFINRSQINEQLKAQLKSLCPILIKGSILEAGKQS